ncbi:zinc finger protein 816-like [Bradysia coprophila]|uniref:zinc finger protein 816-like n=1 Tax=Bradysia coprophila TaxID=38358 RepID=UPI00187DA7A7|nr:zinc finger protein 816-like [Bradysia coprophila]
MSEIISIKQEPELDIFSDGEGDEDSKVIHSDTVRSNEYFGEHFYEGANDTYSITIKSEQNENKEEWAIYDTTKTDSLQCHICSKVYSTKQSLKLHNQSVHMHLRPFKCELCQRSFADKYTLTTHTRIHSGSRPYACPYCEKNFVQHSALTKHKRVHTKEKPFKCEICFKAFSDRSSLIPHRKLHTGVCDRPFRCEICKADFIKNSHLVSHNKTKSHLKELAKCKDKIKFEADELT